MSCLIFLQNLANLMLRGLSLMYHSIEHSTQSCSCTFLNLTCRAVYDLTTVTNNELEHAQSNRHMVLLGVVDRRGRYRFIVLVQTCGECLASRSDVGLTVKKLKL